MEKRIYDGIVKISEILGSKYKFLGTGMHPLLKLENTSVWEHGEEGRIYKEYDRVFNIKQHGFLNIQALQINIPYKNEENMVSLYNRIRSLLPFLISLTSASPIVEGKLTGVMDNRLIYYRENQKKIPIICNNIISNKLRSADDYRELLSNIYYELRRENADILCQEWVPSMGIIVRYSRKCLEIKALDEQECVYSDIAISSLIRSLLRNMKSEYIDNDDDLLDLVQNAIESGTRKMKDELEDIYKVASKNTNKRDLRYLSLIKERIDNGSLAETMVYHLVKENIPLIHIMNDLYRCLMKNEPYHLRV